MAIRYLDGKRLLRTLHAGLHRVLAREEHLNAINVFPVPDADTGTNLAYTLAAIRDRTADQADGGVGAASRRIADAALDGARGNSGAILAQFLVGFAESIHDQPTLTTRQFSAAVTTASHYASDALLEPREGTMLSVIRDWAAYIAEHSDRVHDFRELLQEGLERARASLAETTDKLEALRSAGVVDAGAQGFVFLLEGVQEFIACGEVRTATFAPPPPAAGRFDGEGFDDRYRYCTECMISGEGLPLKSLRRELAQLGGSLVVAGSASRVRVHVHTDTPQAVFRVCRQFGRLADEKVDDMVQQQRDARSPHELAIVMDSACDLPSDLLEEHNIHVIPVKLGFGDESYLDGVGMTAGEFWQKIDEAPVHPRTSQPAPGEFRRLYERLAKDYRTVLSLHIPAGASGTLQAARVGARGIDGCEVVVMDSLNFSVGAGLVVLRAAEALQAGLPPAEVLAVARAAAQRTKIYVGLDTLEFAVRGGRISRAKKRVIELLRANPVLTLDDDGRVAVAGKTFASRGKTAKLVEWVLARLPAGAPCRFGVAYSTDAAAAEAAAAMLRERTGAERVLITRVGPALAIHAGPGALAIAVQQREVNA